MTANNAKQPGLELATTQQTADGYAVMGIDPQELQEVLTDNLGGQGLSARDLPRVTVPSGGGTIWEVPGPAGAQHEPTLDGVIVNTRLTRGYWQSDDANGSPPDCASPDGEYGRGLFGQGSERNPAGSCAVCPMAQFGSSPKGDGQACKQKQELYLVRVQSVLPLVVVAPPTSLAAIRRYMVDLASAGLRHYGVITRLTLRQDANARGQKFSAIVPAMAGALTPQQVQQMRGYREGIRQVLSAAETAEMIAG